MAMGRRARLLSRVRFLVLAVALLSALPAAAHEVRPAYLAIAELEAGRFSVVWKIPMRGDLVMPMIGAAVE